METHKHTQNRQTVPLTSDLVFKYVFGAEQSVEILRSLLSAVQEDAGCPEVATVQIPNPFNQKNFADDKLSVVDVKATDVTGATYTMEAQATWHKAFASRALYYWARSYGNQLSELEICSRLQPVRVPSTAFGRWMYYKLPRQGGDHGRSDYEGESGRYVRDQGAVKNVSGGVRRNAAHFGRFLKNPGDSQGSPRAHQRFFSIRVLAE